MILQKFNLQTYSVFESPNLKGGKPNSLEQPTLILTLTFNLSVRWLEANNF